VRLGVYFSLGHQSNSVAGMHHRPLCPRSGRLSARIGPSVAVQFVRSTGAPLTFISRNVSSGSPVR
jgi:hypothetical protein